MWTAWTNYLIMNHIFVYTTFEKKIINGEL